MKGLGDFGGNAAPLGSTFGVSIEEKLGRSYSKCWPWNTASHPEITVCARGWPAVPLAGARQAISADLGNTTQHPAIASRCTIFSDYLLVRAKAIRTAWTLLSDWSLSMDYHEARPDVCQGSIYLA